MRIEQRKGFHENYYIGSLHTSHLKSQQWQSWRSQGLFLFFLPPYSSEMNRIEEQWHQLKSHEIVGRMFEDKYNLALAIMDGMEAHSVKGNYTLERFSLILPDYLVVFPLPGLVNSC